MQYALKVRTFFIALLVVISLPATAMTLQEAMTELTTAKQEGLVGERDNGYLGVVEESEHAEQIVRLINDARRAEYTRIAERNNIAVSDVEALAGQRAIERTASGHYIQIDGRWMRQR